MRRGATLNASDFDASAICRFRNSWTQVESGCWEWKHSRVRDGYAQFAWKQDGKWRQAAAHRVAHCLATGSVDGGAYVLHSCDNPGCVRPDHLRPGTQTENMREMMDRGRGVHRRKEECKRGHPMDGPQMYYWHGRRQCGECMRIVRNSRKQANNQSQVA